VHAIFARAAGANCKFRVKTRSPAACLKRPSAPEGELIKQPLLGNLYDTTREAFILAPVCLHGGLPTPWPPALTPAVAAPCSTTTGAAWLDGWLAGWLAALLPHHFQTLFNLHANYLIPYFIPSKLSSLYASCCSGGSARSPSLHFISRPASPLFSRQLCLFTRDIRCKINT
jgi:hypothetical protein